jgi:glycine cleavage system H protein
VYPDDVKYTAEHEWVRSGAGAASGSASAVRVGITDYAQDALGDVVFVSLPEPGTEVTAGQPCGEIESTKSVSDVFAPVSGTVVTRNDTLESQPDLVNTDPYGDGWLVEIEPADPSAVEGLMGAADYQKSLETS